MKKHHSAKGTFPMEVTGKEDWPHFTDVLKQKPKSVTISSWTKEGGYPGGPQANVDYAGKKK